MALLLPPINQIPINNQINFVQKNQVLNKSYYQKNNFYASDSSLSNVVDLKNKNIEAIYSGPASGNQVFGRHFDGAYASVETDFKTDSFVINFSASWQPWYNSSADNPVPTQFSVRINNDNQFVQRIEKQSNKRGVGVSFDSKNFSQPIKYSEVKTISLEGKIENIGVRAAFKILENVEPDKKELVLEPELKDYTFKIQSGISVGSSRISEPIYTEFKLKPLQITEGKNNQFFLELSVEKEEDFKKIDFKPLKIGGLPLSGNSNVEPNKAEIDAYFDNGTKQIYINDYSFYDPKEQKTKIGIHEKASLGYVIPYNFGKNFNPTLQFNVNEFENIKLTWTQRNIKPYFSEKKGKIKLVFSSEEDPDIPEDNWSTINPDFFKDEQNQNLNYHELLEKLKNQN